MIDHIGISVSDFEKSKAFYSVALQPIGYTLLKQFKASETGAFNVAGFGDPGSSADADFWISDDATGMRPIHIAFRVASRAMVDAFHSAGLEAGGTDNGPPGLRPHYGPCYYAAYVHDPQGHNIEAVCYAAG